jgi:hypothetical protein
VKKRVTKKTKAPAKKVTPKKATPAKKTTKAGSSRKRIVLSPAQRKMVIAKLKKKTPAHKVAEKFGVSMGTVNNIKKAAGMT